MRIKKTYFNTQKINMQIINLEIFPLFNEKETSIKSKH